MLDYLYREKNDLNLYPTLYTKINLKWIMALNCKTYNHKSSGRKWKSVFMTSLVFLWTFSQATLPTQSTFSLASVYQHITNNCSSKSLIFQDGNQI